MRPALGVQAKARCFFVPILFCLSTESFCGENLAGKRRRFCASKWHFLVLPWTCVCCVKEGFLSSASFVSRSSHPTSPIKHVGMEALGEFVACQCVGIWHLFFFFFFLGLLAFVARGLRSDLLAFATPPRSLVLTGLSPCWCCLHWTFRSLEQSRVHY
ncbi:hypothetical protein V8C40DRAFT_149812 [Trichoderma camerunense]